tara:strand:+ start:63 stop:320 length:258 start_codon:yes stop_codon:yes gene_type:complete
MNTKKELVINHEYFTQDFMSTALRLLQAYQDDVKYWTNMGVDTFNFCTSGSPCWEEGEEDKMRDYDNFVRNFVAVFQTELQEDES